MPLAEFLASQFPENLEWQQYHRDLHDNFVKSGIADPNFTAELTSGVDGRFEERRWEMVLFGVLHKQGHEFIPKKAGPDFCLKSGEGTVWVECVVPSPTGLTDEWLAPPEPDAPVKVKTVPHEEIVLRWTAALKEKFERLEGCTDKKTGEHKPGYVGKGIVAREDIYVVAVDGSRLSDHQRNTGISEFPYAVEAVFPLGPVAISIDPDGANPKVHRTLRYEVLNKNKRPVPTNIFLNPEYSGVSALLGCTGTRYGDLTELKMIVVHNPNAPVRLPKRFFGPNVTEYESTKLENGEYTWPSPIEDALPSP